MSFARTEFATPQERFRAKLAEEEYIRQAKRQNTELGVRPEQYIEDREPTQMECSGYGSPVPRVIRAFENRKRQR